MFLIYTEFSRNTTTKFTRLTYLLYIRYQYLIISSLE